MDRKDAYKLSAPVYDWVIEPFLAPIRKKTGALLAGRRGASGGLRVLEVACGTGSQAKRIAQDGPAVVAVDRSPAMLVQGAKKQGGFFSMVGADATRLPFPGGTFDAVVVQLALHEMPGHVRTAALREMIRVARAGADFLAADFLPATGVTLKNLALTAVEFAAGKSHFRNGRLFLAEGGIVSFLTAFGLEVIDTWPFFGGNIGLVLAKKPA